MTVTANDGQSGLATSETYKYYINSESMPKGINTTGSYTFTELSAETMYTIKVEVRDKAGKEVTESKTATTTQKLATNVDELKAGDYVYHIDGKGTRRTCAVLYDSSSSYGVELITMESVEDVVIGSNTDAEGCISSYNGFISMLNSRVLEYNNQTYSNDARSVGSNPKDKNHQSGYYFLEARAGFQPIIIDELMEIQIIIQIGSRCKN